MINTYLQFFNKILGILFLEMNFKNSLEFEKKYIAVSIQRGKLFKWVTFAISFYSFYLDLTLHKDDAIDMIYRQNLMTLHIIILVLSLVYIAIYKLLENAEQRRSSYIVKAVIISDMFLTILIASILSLNSQRFTGNIDAYIMTVFAVALVVSLYPKWLLGIYGVNHIFFLIGISYVCKDNTALLKQLNATTVVLVAFILFLMMYRYNIKNFINEEMLKEDKSTFLKLFEMNPFPLLVSRFEDGKIQYANRKAMLFYDIQQETLDTLNHSDLYINTSDLEAIREILARNEKVNDYVVEQKSLSGQMKFAIVNYALIDYFGGKSILSGAADITEIKRIEKELTIHASTDILTGVLNRRAGMDLITKAFEIARQEETEFNLCFFDIDNLKMVNDKFGHLEGDSLITDICNVIRSQINPGDMIFRYGGDEFMLLFENTCEHEINEIRYRIDESFETLNKNK